MRQFLVVSKSNNKEIKQTFILNNNNFSQAISSNKNDYTTILHNNSNEIINHPEDANYKQIWLDKLNTISLKNQDYKNIIKEYKNFNNYCVFSPFHVLLDNIKLNYAKNSLNLYFYENTIYMAILDSNNYIIYSNSIKISSFEDIKETNFYEKNELTDLYNEVIPLETIQIIKDNLNMFYNQSNSFFIENIQVFGKSNILEKNDLLIDTIHTTIDLDDTLLRLTQKELNYNKLSYTTIKKDTNQKYKLPIILLSLATLISIYFIYTSTVQNKQIPKPINIINKNKSILPDHRSINNKIKNDLENVFSTITYDMYINQIIFNKNNSIMDINYLYPDTFIKTTKDNLKKIYLKTSIVEENYIDNLYITKINNQNLISNIHNIKVKNIEYPQENYTSDQVKDFIFNLLPKNSNIIHTNKTSLQNNIYSYDVQISIDTPTKFFKLIEELNKQDKSLNLTYPIIFKRNGLQVNITFILEYHKNL